MKPAFTVVEDTFAGRLAVVMAAMGIRKVGIDAYRAEFPADRNHAAREVGVVAMTTAAGKDIVRVSVWEGSACSVAVFPRTEVGLLMLQGAISWTR
jgi:hypothetical protein